LQEYSKDQGGSLIEVLIAMLVMSISLFGFFEYFSQTRRNMNSQVGLVAAQYVGDFLLTSIRQHMTPINQALYEGLSMTGTYTLHNCTNAFCSDEDIAERDLALFVREATSTLNNPQTKISFIEGYVQLELSWSDPLRPIQSGDCSNEAGETQSCITLFKSL